MHKIQNTDEKCREIIGRLLALTDAAPANSIARFYRKTLLDFNIEEGWIDFKYVADKTMLNIIGAVHGGIMAGLADECMGYGANALIGNDDEVLTTSDMQFNCMKAIHNGDELRIHVTLRHAGKRTIITTAEIFRDDTLVFMATENLARLPKDCVAQTSAINFW